MKTISDTMKYKFAKMKQMKIWYGLNTLFKNLILHLY